ncbi:MAG: sigma-70 family RNA polymerase sigma factor [Planctomycetota bacterium]
MGSGDAEIDVRAHLTAALPELHAFVRAIAGPGLRAHESTEDLVQSVCREALDHEARFRTGGQREFRQWVFREARRKVLSRARHHAAAKRDAGRVELDDDPDALARLAVGYSSFSTPSRRIERKEEVARLERAIHELEDDQRTALLLAHIAQWSRREIAEEMGRSEGAVRMLLHRAVAQLSTRL